MEVPSTYLDRIHTILPDLVITSARLNQDGNVNDIIIINNQLIARFPKNARSKAALIRESRILKLVRDAVAMPVPLFERQEEDIVIYHMIPGGPFTREVLFRHNEQTQERLAEQFALFLSQLHSIPVELIKQSGIGASEAERSYEDWTRTFHDVERELFPYLWDHQKTWVRQLFIPVLDGPLSLQYNPVLIHGDLGVYHILYDSNHQSINGVIDFGTAGLGDPASDYACIIQSLGESFLQRMSHYYPAILAALNRARFRSGALELEWALQGIRHSDPSWWLAHIGGARDIIPLNTQ